MRTTARTRSRPRAHLSNKEAGMEMEPEKVYEERIPGCRIALATALVLYVLFTLISWLCLCAGSYPGDFPSLWEHIQGQWHFFSSLRII